ncbi:MAG: transglycosylase domain-containing protein [Alphaproteobacteria bacterium]|nr:transglycosylase domain-containing protein [Alphaproteobacteria bacterium]
MPRKSPGKPPAPARKRSSTPKAKAAPAKARSKAKPARAPLAWRTELAVVVGGVVLGVALLGAVLFLEARREVAAWIAHPPESVPTVVWSAPVRVERGQPYPQHELVADLIAAGYEQAAKADAPGRFAVAEDGNVHIWTEGLDLPGITVAGVRQRVRILGNGVAATEPSSGVTLRPVPLATLGDLDRRRTPVTLDDVVPELPTAVLAIEDARFHDHVGVDPVGIVRALVHNLRGRDLHGGSTLTQQLAKNLFLGRERTVRRKVREVFYAAALESLLDKDALLELYLSEVYLGHVGGVALHGVEQASRAWFGKAAGSLTVGEAATIAGVIASPNVWSPLRDAEQAARRRNQVIDRMVAVHALTEAQAELARAEGLTTIATPPSASWRAPWAVDAALEETGRLLGATFTVGAGDAVHTTVQPHLQRAAQRAVTDGLASLGDEDAEGAMVVLEAATGRVLALVGGKDFGTSPFNRAVRARRQPGSTVKPLMLLASLDADPALSPASRVDDDPLTVVLDGRSWSPRNYDGTHLGELPLGRALEQSRNLPFVRLARALGWPEVQRTLRAVGLSEATSLPSVALGAFPATPLEVAGAYTVLPAGGERRAPTLVHRVLGVDGAVRLTGDPLARRVATPRSAAVVTRMLQGVLDRGTAQRARSLGIGGDWAGKTGTTDDGRDAWFVGFDPQVVIAAWVGQDRGSLGLAGSQAALPVWARFAGTLDERGLRFARPDTVEEVLVCDETFEPPCPSCTAKHVGWFPATAVPERRCGLHALIEPPPEAGRDPADEEADEVSDPAAPRRPRRRERR